MQDESLVRVKNILSKLNKEDSYPQPLDVGHLQGTIDVIEYYKSLIIQNKSVLDVGCGQGNAAKHFEQLGLSWTGVNIGEDYKICKLLGLNVIEDDMTFMNLQTNSYEFGFARHIIEHSPMPLITLINLNIILSKHLLLVLPNPDHYKVFGRNHYSVLYYDQWKWLLARSGWRTINERVSPEEFWFYCVKDKPRKNAPYELTEYDESEKDLT